MTLIFRLTLCFILSWLAASRITTASAQETPRLLTMLVGYPAGGSADLTARIIAENLSAELGRTVIVENRAGAGGQLAARAFKGAVADGSVLMMGNSHTMVTVPLVTKEPGFSTLTDFRPVSNIGTYALALAVHPKTQAKSLRELVAWLKVHPRESNIAIPAAASSPEFMVDRLRRHFGFDAQIVSYRGSASAIQDLLGGQIPAAIVPVTDLLPYHNAARIEIIAVTGRTRLLPEVLSFAELGVDGLDLSEFYALYAPTLLSDALTERYRTAMRRVLGSPKVMSRFETLGIEVDPSSPEQQRRAAEALSNKVADLIKTSGFIPQ